VPDEPYSSIKLLNYITSPDVIIASAVIASSAIPHVLQPVTLKCKDAKGVVRDYLGSGARWRDGSLRADIPERELQQLYDVRYSIVSQTNPHILVFFYERMGSAGVPTAHRRGMGWRGGFLASALIQHAKLDMLKWYDVSLRSLILSRLYLLRDLSLTPLTLTGTDISEVFSQNYTGLFHPFYTLALARFVHHARYMISSF
jgi:predicted acylesterase/phospholipase RssA